MNCENAIELLPWLLNGSLEPEEAAEARRHLEGCEACRQSWRETRQAWKVFSEHLPAEALVQLAYDEPLSGLDAGVAERQLGSCPQCAAELEMARMSRRLEEDDRIATFPAPARRPREVRTWRLTAMAAGLAAVVAAGGWFQSLSRLGELSTLVARNQGEVRSAQQELARIAANVREPQLNTWTGDVSTSDVVRGNQPADQEIPVPANVDSTPMLEASHDITAPDREVRIVDAAGKVLFRRGGLRRNPTDDFTITFHAGFLKPGHYTIQLYTPEGKPAETYTIRVVG